MRFEDTDLIIMQPLVKGNGVNPYWTYDDILIATGGKLRRLAVEYCGRQEN